MTRGRIIYISSDLDIYETREFNGDMYPEGYAVEIIDRFEEGGLATYQDFDRFVHDFNGKHYEYEDDLIDLYRKTKNCVIDLSDNWTDYVYVINESPDEFYIKAKEGSSFISPRSIGIVHYQRLDKIIHRVVHEKSEANSLELTKEEFVAIMHKLQDTTDVVREINRLIECSKGKMDLSPCSGSGMLLTNEGLVLMLLKKLMKDNHVWVDYFVNGLDYGRSFKIGMVKDAGGRSVDISTAEKLYDFIVNTK